jgi:hypothetical protein
MRFENGPRGKEAGMDPERDQTEETGRPTQERMDEEGPEARPVDVDWEENEPSPHQGEEGTDPAA